MITRYYAFSGRATKANGYKTFSGTGGFKSWRKNPVSVYNDLLKEAREKYKGHEVHILFFQQI